jgi:hypothetical protein
VDDEVRYEVKLANGDVELADSLWGARHIVAQRAAFAPDPLRPTSVLPATISALGRKYFGGRAFVEQLTSVSELSAQPPE